MRKFRICYPGISGDMTISGPVEISGAIDTNVLNPVEISGIVDVNLVGGNINISDLTISGVTVLNDISVTV